MEKQTLSAALNEFSQGTTDNIDSIMIKDAAGKPYWIKKADLASVLGGLIKQGTAIQVVTRWGSTGNQTREFFQASGSSYHSFLFNISRIEGGAVGLYNVICTTTSSGNASMLVKTLSIYSLSPVVFKFRKDENGISHFYIKIQADYAVCAVTELSYYPNSCDNMQLEKVEEPSDSTVATMI